MGVWNFEREETDDFLIIEGDSACVIENYDYVFPNGKAINRDVATIWKVKAGKLDELRIFFDTSAFQANTKRKHSLNKIGAGRH
jgi:ketosteroid isomerase-like protein